MRHTSTRTLAPVPNIILIKRFGDNFEFYSNTLGLRIEGISGNTYAEKSDEDWSENDAAVLVNFEAGIFLIAEVWST